MADANSQWSYPGARWWKFDFHTHTPASLDVRGLKFWAAIAIAFEAAGGRVNVTPG